MLKSTVVYAAVVFAYPPFANAQTTSFDGVGQVPGRAGSFAFDVSYDGQTVTGNTGSPSDAFVWTSVNGIQQAGGSDLGFIEGISGDGAFIVGGRFTGQFDPNGFGIEEPAVWSMATGTIGLGSLTPNDGFPSRATATTFDGSVVVGYATPTSSNSQAWRWTATGGIEGLGFLSPGQDDSTRAVAISDDGSKIFGTSVLGGTRLAFVWTESAGIEPIQGLREVIDVSADGDTILGISQSFEFVVRRDGEDTVLPVEFQWVEALSPDGSVVAGGAGFGDNDIFLWRSDTGLLNLETLLEGTSAADDLDGWDLFRPKGLSFDGSTIAGTGQNPLGENEGWVATVVIPVPSVCDFNGDGELNFFDIAAFVAAFNDQDLSADFAAPFGVLNFFDIAEYIGQFSAGCP